MIVGKAASGGIAADLVYGGTRDSYIGSMQMIAWVAAVLAIVLFGTARVIAVRS